MKINELNNTVNEILVQEAKKLIMEQVTEVEHMLDSVKSFQTLSGLTDKITELEDAGTDNTVIFIRISNLSPEELVKCCGGSSLAEAEKNLMQGLHHDLEDNGFEGSYDVDVVTQGDENNLELVIRITPNDDELSGDNNMEKDMKETGTAKSFGEELYAAKEAGTKKFNHEGQEFDVDECWKQLEEEEMIVAPVDEKKKEPEILLGNKETEINESVEKRVITLNENEMKELIKKIVVEASEFNVDQTTELAQSEADKQNKAALKAVEEKIRKYLSFEGNDNPEFPNQIGQGEEKVARKNTDEQDQIVDDNRGRGPQDLDYDIDGVDDNGEPNKKFQDRLEKALTGDSKMGNSQDALNAIKTDTGEKMVKNMKRRRENLRKEPIYPKEAVPVKTKPENEPVRPVNEEKDEKRVIVEEEIKKMKRLASYNDKTQ